VTVPEAPAQRPLEFTALGRAWCASALPLMAVLGLALVLAFRAPVLNLILAIAWVATPCGAAVALARCRKAARLQPLTQWDVLWSFLTTGAMLGPAIPVVIVAGVFLFTLPGSLSHPPSGGLPNLVALAAIFGMLTGLIGLLIALPVAWLAGWIASRTGFRRAAPVVP